MFDLTGKVAIVTGSSRGIGRAIAGAMAQAGASVVVSSRKADACEEAASEIREAGGTVKVLPCNVGDKQQLESLVRQTQEVFGGVDIVVCNAAANPSYGPMRELEDSAFDKIMTVNVQSNLWLANLVAPSMVERGGGSMILIASIAGLGGSRSLGAYAVSKAAQFQLARNLAVEWGRKGIRANCIAPGLVKTDFAKALWENEALRTAFEKKTPLGRLGEPEDIAGAAVFLASDAARYMTGQALVVDGGLMSGGEL
ncbi:MAG: SDR family oxidoreductase [Myxococcota bacterium]|nr:SDR family oxidoreductase [Myxococcota bacterium]